MRLVALDKYVVISNSYFVFIWMLGKQYKVKYQLEVLEAYSVIVEKDCSILFEEEVGLDKLLAILD